MLACAPIARVERGGAVERALLAQATGLGGCDVVSRLDTLSSQFHPELTFIEGACLLEHGDTAYPLVAVDRGGQIYVLDNPSSFAFMIRMHPPPQVARERAVEYATVALRMMGRLTPQDRVVRSSSEIPDSLLSVLGASREEFWDSSRVLRDLSRGYEVALVAVGPSGIKSAVGLVYADSGSIEMVVEQRRVPRVPR
jgi:hypothetical protein